MHDTIHKGMGKKHDTLCNKLAKDPVVQFGGGASFGLEAGVHRRFPLDLYRKKCW
jgi:hypothetical protein